MFFCCLLTVPNSCTNTFPISQNHMVIPLEKEYCQINSLVSHTPSFPQRKFWFLISSKDTVLLNNEFFGFHIIFGLSSKIRINWYYIFQDKTIPSIQLNPVSFVDDLFSITFRISIYIVFIPGYLISFTFQYIFGTFHKISCFPVCAVAPILHKVNKLHVIEQILLLPSYKGGSVWWHIT